MKFFYNVHDRRYFRFKSESCFEGGEVTIDKIIPEEIKIGLY
jgi:hypothetical protein